MELSSSTSAEQYSVHPAEAAQQRAERAEAREQRKSVHPLPSLPLINIPLCYLLTKSARHRRCCNRSRCRAEVVMITCAGCITEDQKHAGLMCEQMTHAALTWVQCGQAAGADQEEGGRRQQQAAKAQAAGCQLQHAAAWTSLIRPGGLRGRQWPVSS